ncbi:MAG: CDP-alcohol phosphatidyltransferase family protein, partial [Proteobacteria bacterium]|nr:CDP-alcohol phosphatidyltransferase family protein [Pseudomonadota bacterium]
PSMLALLAGRYELTLLLFGVAAISDALDGWLAKTFGWTSRLGKILDPIADKLLLVCVFLTLAWLGRVPVWLVATVVLRDLLIVSGAAAYHFLIGYLEGHPTPVSKLNTLLQLLLVLAVTAAAAWPAVPSALLVALGAATFVTTVVSGIDYVMTYARAAVRARRGHAPAVS